MAATHHINMGSGRGKRNGNAWPRARRMLIRLPRRAAHYLIRAYQLTVSGITGRQCRYLPSCSAYMDEAIARHGLYAGGMMGLARLCRCHPFGNYGFDPVPHHLPQGSSWARPWRYGDWHGPLHCEEIIPQDSEQDAEPSNPDDAAR